MDLKFLQLQSSDEDMQDQTETEKRDLNFISGLFFTYRIPKGKSYLLKYFTGPLQVAFLKYYCVTGKVTNFTNHTGYYCSERLAYRFQNRYHRLIEIYDTAKSSLTEEGMQTIDLIESGRFRLTKLKEWPTI